MPLRKYRFLWITDVATATSVSRVVSAEDAKDAIIMFEHEHRSKGVPKYYTIAAIAPDACPTCMGFPYERDVSCWQCNGTGRIPFSLRETP